MWSPFRSGRDAQPRAELGDAGVLAERDEVKAGDARLRERVRRQLVGDLEALGLGVGGGLDAARGSRAGRRCPGRFSATKRMPPTVRRMQIDGISASRSLSPVSCGAAHEALEQLGPVAELQLQEAGAGVGLLGGAADAVLERRRARVLDRADEEVRAPGRSRGPRGSGPPPASAASAISCGPSRSNTRRASGSSPAVTSSPVRQQMFSMPCIAAPTRSACSASRLRSRQVSCMIGSTPALISADRDRERRAVGVRRRVVGRVERVDEGPHRLELALDSAWPPPSITGISAVTTNSPASSLRSRFDIRPPPSPRASAGRGR